jgi:starch-binding outer membrane protein, SusD/RagB family
MKRTYFLLLIGVGVLVCSCEKELDQKPISSATTATFYATSNDFIQGVNAIYADLSQPYQAYPDRQLNLSETRSDNLYATTPGGMRDWDPVNDFKSTLANNPFISEAWRTNYNGISRANVLLDELQKNGNVITDAKLRNRLEGEAKFLRAFYYFDLVRWFGKVPLIDHPISAKEALALPRSPVSDVYKLIISDLTFAGDNLPASYTGADVGRATKYAAKGFLALVYMTRSGPTYNIEGPGLGLNEWSQAESLLNEIIASNQYAFLPDYSSIFSYNNENNKEVIFDVQYKSGGLGLGASFVWVLTPDQYFNSKGLPFQGANGIRPISNDLLNSYDPNDARKAFSIQTGYTYAGTTETRSFLVKYVDINGYGLSNIDWPINFIVMRYTDVLMLKAECILHGAPGTQADVDAIVNQVRQRAGIAPISNVTLPQLMEERRKEFIGEGLRWHDLVRSGLVTTVMPAWIASEDVQHQIDPFNVNDIIYPIPQSEMDVKQGLYDQNPGY